MGLVINHIVPGLQLDKLIGQFNLQSDIRIDLDPLRFPVISGGPLETARGFLLHSADFRRTETLSIDSHYGLTGTVEALKDVVQGEGPDHMLFILGYAGWSAGQLDQELQQNSWLVVDPDPALVFEAQPEEKWLRAIQKLGIDPVMLSGVSGSA